MIQQAWDKKVIAQIQMHPNDVADDIYPLPLFLELPWNHYLAFYFDQVIAFFASYTVYPWNKSQFYLTLDSHNLPLNGTEIVGHLVSLYGVGIEKPIRMTCRFRNNSPLPSIQIKKFFKYTLKASTAIRNAKLGASILTLQMSIENVQKLYESFVRNDITEYLGSNDFQSTNLGFSFVISKTERIPVRIFGLQFVIQRGVDKDTSLGKLLAYVFKQAGTNIKETQEQQKKSESETHELQETQKSNQQHSTPQKQNISYEPPLISERQKAYNRREKEKRYNYIFEKYSFHMHGIKVTRGQYPLSFFERFCHPDGFLYIFFKENT